MSKKRSKKNGRKSKMLRFSIILFVILAIIALLIVLNKGKIGEYSLVKIETGTKSEEEQIQEPENKMEIAVEKKFLAVKKKEETEISVTLNGEGVNLNDVELTSSNEKVIKIKDGMAVAVSVGKATLTAKKDDLEATVDVRAIIPITSMTFTTTSSTMKVGKSLQMKLTAKPSDANIETLQYESSDEKIATVNSNGIVTAVAPGTVTITVTDRYSELEKSVKLTIKK